MLDLKKLLDGSVPSVDFSLELNPCDFIDNCVSGTVTASGVITNRSGLVLLSGVATPNLLVNCGRCGREFNYTTPFDLNGKITDKLANADEDEFILMQDFAIDIEDILRTAIILELPTRFLCSEDCKGLCPKCGCDLNQSQCQCDLTRHDSRWDALKDFFD